MIKRVLSGMRPTGNLHLGHLKGALENWQLLQDRYECLYMIADWHALMSEYASPKNLAENTYQMILDWLACGIDPEKNIIFCQSKVASHAELYLLLSIITPIGWLERNPTYKEQIKELQNVDLSTHGFLGYPILQAGDILLYKATIVPIGVDQLPHLELTREIVRRFNHFYGKTFEPPEAILTETPKLPGTDGKKMSKSYNNAIFISDSESATEKKIRSMITDPERIHPTDKGHPDVCNIFSFQVAFNLERVKEIEALCQEGRIGCVICKNELSSCVNIALKEIREKRKVLEKDRKYLLDILDEGNRKAVKIAGETMAEIREKVGFYQ
ncbi:MAG: tryptophan--tRNA ligase [Candidatus Desantisbacteria bacterium]